MWHIGQKVVCINDTWLYSEWDYVPNKPVRGQVYTIRAINPDWYRDGIDGTAFLLEEVINEPLRWMQGDGNIVFEECHFWSARFRPLKEKKTDISAFTSLLKTKTKELENV